MDSSAFNHFLPWEAKAVLIMLAGILIFIITAPLWLDVNIIELTEEETVLQGCRGVCDNSDAYDIDMLIVRRCDEILKNYGKKGCFATWIQSN